MKGGKRRAGEKEKGRGKWTERGAVEQAIVHSKPGEQESYKEPREHIVKMAELHRNQNPRKRSKAQPLSWTGLG